VAKRRIGIKGADIPRAPTHVMARVTVIEGMAVTQVMIDTRRIADATVGHVAEGTAVHAPPRRRVMDNSPVECRSATNVGADGAAHNTMASACTPAISTVHDTTANTRGPAISAAPVRGFVTGTPGSRPGGRMKLA
ncbi:MAG: hypothetical protein ACRD3O_04175, partial [Terriglobia bacterium]